MTETQATTLTARERFLRRRAACDALLDWCVEFDESDEGRAQAAADAAEAAQDLLDEANSSEEETA